MNDLRRMTEQVAARAGRLVLYARQWLDAASAEDVAQEALVRLLAQRTAPDDPVAWVYRTVRNAAIDCARSASRRRSREDRVAQARPEWFEPAMDLPIDARLAQQALATLPVELAEVVILRIWGDLGFAQIAEILGFNVSTAHRRYVTGLRQLRLALEKPCQKKMD